MIAYVLQSAGISQTVRLDHKGRQSWVRWLWSFEGGDIFQAGSELALLAHGCASAENKVTRATSYHQIDKTILKLRRNEESNLYF